MPLLFEQQPRESNKAYAAFKAYLDMGSERSVREVARLCSKSASLIARWSAKYDWPARVQAFNASIAERERMAIQERVVEKAVEWERLHEGVKREAWQEAEETIKLVRMARKEWEEKKRVPGWEGMARMLELAFKLKQFAAGMASEVKEVNTTVTGTIDVEWEIAIRKAYGKVEEGPKPEARSPKETVIDVEAIPSAEPGARSGERGHLTPPPLSPGRRGGQGATTRRGAG